MNNDNFLIINDFSQIPIDVYPENSVAFIQTVWDAVNGFDVDWRKELQEQDWEI